MAAQVSAGVLAWRRGEGGPEFLLVHPGGPYWRGKDQAAWSIPKGLVEADEEGWAAARREFEEELGQPIGGKPVELTPVRAGAKTVHAWLVEADVEVSAIRSNTFQLEWPPRSGLTQSFPEIDQAAWFDGPTALVKVHKGQRPILEEAIRLTR